MLIALTFFRQTASCLFFGGKFPLTRLLEKISKAMATDFQGFPWEAGR